MSPMLMARIEKTKYPSLKDYRLKVTGVKADEHPEHEPEGREERKQRNKNNILR